MKEKLKTIFISEIYRHFILGIFFNIISIASNLVVISILTRLFDKVEFANYLIFLTLSNLAILLTYPGFVNIINKGVIKSNFLFVKKAIHMSLNRAKLLSPIVILCICAFYIITKKEQLSLLAIISTAFIPLLAWDRSESILMGVNDFKKYRQLKFFQSVFNIIIVGGTAFIFRNIVFTALAYLIVRFLTAYIGMKSSRTYLLLPTIDKKENTDELVREGVQFGLLVWFNMIVDNLDKFVLYNLGAAGLADFYTGGNIPLKCKDYMKSASIVPLMSWLKKGDEFYRIKMKKYGLIMLVGLLFFCIILACSAPFFIPYIFGDKYINAIPVAQVMSFVIFPQVLGNFLAMKSIVHEHSRYYQNIVYIKQTVYLILLFPIIYYYKAVGAASLVLGVAMLNLFLHIILYKVKEK